MNENKPAYKYASVRMDLPGPESRRMIEEWKRHEADKTGFQAPVAIEHGHGAMLYDVDGNSFLDWTSGVLVTNVGHCHPKLVEAVKAASEKMLNVYEYCNAFRANAARDLVQAAPGFLDSCFFLSSGSEAVDSAVRIMKRATGKFEIVCFYGGFHGRTMSAASFGGMAKPKKGYGPATPGAIRVPFPYCYRCPFHSCIGKCGFMCLEFIDDAIRANSADSLAGMIVEPYLGTAGFIFAPDGYMKQLEGLARDKGMLFALDEVQSCCGRTGTMWALEHDGLEPDIVALGKGLGSGVTVSALLMRGGLADSALGKGEMGSTYGGNPVACAAVSAVLDIIKSEDILGNVRRISAIFRQRLPALLELSKHVGDIRGRGLVWGIELVEDKLTKAPAPEYAKKLVESCAANGLLTGIVGIYGNVIRVAPPLVINEGQAHESMDIMESVLATAI